ncbi:MAG: hypothetical protein QW791_01660 [Candidatus Bathyarchaeia archaeon]
MEYEDFRRCVKNFEDYYWFGEYVYFKALEEFERVRADLSKIDSEEHLEKIAGVFLAQWGQMGRTVFRKESWQDLADQLRRAENEFKELEGKSLLDVDLNDKETLESIKEAYNAVRAKYIGPTAVSKILHLLNPELFIMWDEKIREEIKERIKGEKGVFPKNADGYVEFLRFMKNEIVEALNEEATRRGCSKIEIVKEVCTDLPSKNLDPEYRRKTLAKLIDEYNWWKVREKPR